MNDVLLHIAFILVLLVVVLTVAGLLTWIELRVLALVQDRYGPKEDWIPPFADRPLFVLAPTIIITTVLVSLAVVPFSPGLVVQPMNVGLLFFLGMSSLGVFSTALGGWASNNKYALLGALRSTAQMLGYEVFMGLSVMGVVILSGSFDLYEIVEAQRGMWFIVPQFLGFVLFVIAGSAESRRIPFDLPESESELVAGFHVEYSGMKFGMFFVGEYLGLILVSAMITVLFLGGWHGPLLPPLVWFLLKVFALIFSSSWRGAHCRDRGSTR